MSAIAGWSRSAPARWVQLAIPPIQPTDDVCRALASKVGFVPPRNRDTKIVTLRPGESASIPARAVAGQLVPDSAPTPLPAPDTIDGRLV